MPKLSRFLKILTTRFFKDLCPTRAASLTFITLLSIVPLAIFIFYILSFFPALQTTSKQIELFVLNNFTASSAAFLEKQLQDFSSHAHTLSWTMVCSLALITLLMIFNIVDAVNGVWHVRMRRESALLFIVYLIILFIVPIGFAILLLLSSYLTSMPLLSHFVAIDFLKKPFTFLLPLAIEWIAFTLFHWIIPSCRVNFLCAAIAGFITMILFDISKWGFVLYFHYFSTYQLIYGALAAIPIFFVWVYISWLIIIFGALVCQLLQTKTHPAKP